MTLRFAALLGLAALAVHQLRYLAGHPDAPGDALALHGHSYLPAAIALATVLALLALARLASQLPGAPSPHTPPTGGGRTWALGSGSILAVHALQELTEGALAPGHPAGIEALTGDRGWVVLPLALVAGAAMAALLRAADETATCLPAADVVRVVSGARATVLPPAPQARAADALARHLAGRGPPLLSA